MVNSFTMSAKNILILSEMVKFPSKILSLLMHLFKYGFINFHNVALSGTFYGQVYCSNLILDILLEKYKYLSFCKPFYFLRNHSFLFIYKHIYNGHDKKIKKG